MGLVREASKKLMATKLHDFYNTRWHTALGALGGYELDADVAAVLKHVFPPSHHACHGSDAVTRTCHYSNVVAFKSRYYYVTEHWDADGTKTLPYAWITHRPAYGPPMPCDYMQAVTYAQLFDLLAGPPPECSGRPAGAAEQSRRRSLLDNHGSDDLVAGFSRRPTGGGCNPSAES